MSMCAKWKRHIKQQVCIVGTLVLVIAQVFLLRHGMRGVNDSSPVAEAAEAAVPGTLYCDWTEGGPEIFVIDVDVKPKPPRGPYVGGSRKEPGIHVVVHTKDLRHYKADHWYHVAEVSTGRRAELMKAINETSETLYLQVLNPSWMADMSSMTRLLLASTFAHAGTRKVHFVDANWAAFGYSRSTSTIGGPRSPSPPSVSVQRNSTSLTPADKGSNKTDVYESAPVGAQGFPTVNGYPTPGQVGLLEFHPCGRGNEMTLSSASAFSERLNVTADVGTSIANEDGEASFGGGKYTGGGGECDTALEPICVKYLSTVGREKVSTEDWFPSPDDARSFRTAIDTFCPMPFLRGAEEASSGGERHRRVEEDGWKGGGEGGVRRLLLYQRDQSRKIRNAAQVMEDLRERLGGDWVVEEMVHDSDRHPCELVKTVGGVDVLLTSHGFQSMLGLFLRPGALLFEVFPHKYFWGDYAPMVEGLGVRHAWSMSRSGRFFMRFAHPSTETCMKYKRCRAYARNSDVQIEEQDLDRLVELAVPPSMGGNS